MVVEGKKYPYVVTASTNGLVQVWDTELWITGGNRGENESETTLDSSLVASAMLSDGHRVVSLVAQSTRSLDSAGTNVGGTVSGAAKAKKRKVASEEVKSSKKLKVTQELALGDSVSTKSDKELVPKAKVIVSTSSTYEETDKSATSGLVSRKKLQSALNYARYAKKKTRGGK
jgi:hypothetical protein